MMVTERRAAQSSNSSPSRHVTEPDDAFLSDDLQRDFLPLSPSSLNGFHVVQSHEKCDTFVVVSKNATVSFVSLEHATSRLRLIATAVIESRLHGTVVEATCSTILRPRGQGSSGVHVVVGGMIADRDQFAVHPRPAKPIGVLFLVTLHDVEPSQEQLSSALFTAWENRVETPRDQASKGWPIYAMPDFFGHFGDSIVAVAAFYDEHQDDYSSEFFAVKNCPHEEEGSSPECDLPDKRKLVVASDVSAAWKQIMTSSSKLGAITCSDYISTLGMIDRFLVLGHHSGKVLCVWCSKDASPGDNQNCNLCIETELSFDSPISAVKSRIISDAEGQHLFTLVAPARGPVTLYMVEAQSASSFMVAHAFALNTAPQHDVILSAHWTMDADGDFPVINLWTGHFGKVLFFPFFIPFVSVSRFARFRD